MLASAVITNLPESLTVINLSLRVTGPLKVTGSFSSSSTSISATTTEATITLPTTSVVSTVDIVTTKVSVASAAISTSNQSKAATPAAVNLDPETLSNKLASETEP
ncbi:MAG: hypothetical protein HON27_17365 [Candidatus Marinimicrobia bacterium]|nr:hypothetical protein [Candidatus Neomarinimicrobiota bacterium]